MLKDLHRFILFFFVVVVAAFPVGARLPGDAGRVSGAPGGKVSIEVYEYGSVDVHPCFRGGDAAMVRFINDERRYPREAYRDGVEGRVLCGFVVNVDGSVSHVSVLKGVEESLDREAVRVISRMPAWDAGLVGGSPVAVYCIVPVAFRR